MPLWQIVGISGNLVSTCGERDKLAGQAICSIHCLIRIVFKEPAMSDLNELHAALEAIKQNKKSAKLFFYFLNDKDGQMQSGFFSISQGQSCCISYLNKPNAIALSEIPHLHFTKVMSLPATLMDLSSQPFAACELDDVLAQLDPANFIKITPTPEPAPIMQQSIVEADLSAGPAHVFYSHISMQRDVTQLLETLYGSSAEKKVEEIALDSPPHQYPDDFLNKCKLHATMMLGPKKANEIFQPIYDKLAHGHSSRH